MHGNKKILVSWHANPGYIPPFVLSTRQLNVGPKLAPDQAPMMYACWTPEGVYDLKAVLEANRQPTQFDAIVVYADAGRTNLPLNLNAFDCPKVLCVGDTHHLPSPITTMLSYAITARYDFILLIPNRHHLHWFREAGFANVAWLPGIMARHAPRPFTSDRKAEVGFVGYTGQFHVRRRRLLEELLRNAVPLNAMSAPHDQGQDVYASSAVSFNASLNGDLNLRVSEILSAGGCLLTDRLSPECGLDLILEEGRDYAGYDTPEECVEQARALLKNPAHALGLAQAGHRAFIERMLPERRTGELLAWIFDGKLDSLFRADEPARANGGTLNDRVRIYEALQEIHRVEETPRILFLGAVPDVYLADAADLRRLRLFSELPRSGGKRHAIADRHRMESTNWDCVVTLQGTAVPPAIPYAKRMEIAP